MKDASFEAKYSSNFWDFIKLWIKVGMRFPDEYIESVLSNTLGYWDPWKQSTWVEDRGALSHLLIGTGEEIVKKDYFPLANKVYWYLFVELNYCKVPILGYLIRSDFYIWALLFYIFWTVYKKDFKGFACILIPFMYLGTCFLGPIASLRYVYAIVVIFPLLLTNLKKDRKADGEDECQTLMDIF